MSKKISFGAAVAFMAIIAAATFSITWIMAERNFNDKTHNLVEREKMYDKLAEVADYVRQNYIGTITESALRDALAAGYLEGSGDIYARYYDAAAYARQKQDYSNQYVQIGIATHMNDDGYIMVDEVYPDSPAQAAGIQAGDLITRINDTDVTADNYREAAAMLYGEAGTKMNLLVRRGVEETLISDLTRRFVETPSVNSTMLDGAIALVVIKEFNDVTPEQFTKQVDQMIGDGALAFIFDVRGVDTGTLYSVTQVLDKLLPSGPLVSSTDKNGETTLLASSDERSVDLPMAVLVDEKTSGEAELFAVAIRDYNKGQIIGVKTAGKGTMQEIFPLTDGSAIEITTARYNPPYSPSFDGEGVQPDFEVRLSEEGQKGSDPAFDTQLKKAVEAVQVSMNAMNATVVITDEDILDDSRPESVSSAEESDEIPEEESSPEEEASSEESSEDASSEQSAAQNISSETDTSSQAG